jgi:RNA polymerase sigma-70 factor (ECF subfamily)
MGETFDFARLFEKYSGRFIVYAASYVGKDAAQDIVMDAFMYYWERRDKLNWTNPPAYILNTVRHRCLNHIRARKVRVEGAAKLSADHSRMMDLKISTLEAIDPGEIFPDNIYSASQKALDLLPERTREIFILIRMHGYSYKEVAEKLSVTVKNVEFELVKATRLLRAMLK